MGEEITMPKYTQLWNNNQTTLQNKPLKWTTWEEKGIKYVKDMVDNNKLLTFNEITHEFNLSKVETFKYLQISNLIINNFDMNYLKTNSKIEDI